MAVHYKKCSRIGMVSDVNFCFGYANDQFKGTLMLIAWFGLIAHGVFAARNMRTHWPAKTVFGSRVWLTIHKGANITAVALILVAAICIMTAFSFVWQGPWFTNNWAYNSSAGALHSLVRAS